MQTWTASNGVIYLSTQDQKIKAIRGSDGSQIWQSAPIGSSIDYTGMQQNTLLGKLSDQSFFALKVTDGSLLWHMNPGSFKYEPIIDDHNLYLGDDHTLTAWQPDSKKLLWHYKTSSTIFWYPDEIGDLFYLKLHSGEMDVLRASDGKVIWHYPHN